MPITPKVFTTLPPLLITRLLLLPERPTESSALLVQAEFVPVTNTLLLEEEVKLPIKLFELTTLPSLLISRLLPLPVKPTESSLVFVQTEFVPDTSTLLFEETEMYPIYPVVLTALASLLITRLLLLPDEPM